MTIKLSSKWAAVAAGVVALGIVAAGLLAGWAYPITAAVAGAAGWALKKWVRVKIG